MSPSRHDYLLSEIKNCLEYLGFDTVMSHDQLYVPVSEELKGARVDLLMTHKLLPLTLWVELELKLTIKKFKRLTSKFQRFISIGSFPFDRVAFMLIITDRVPSSVINRCKVLRSSVYLHGNNVLVVNLNGFRRIISELTGDLVALVFSLRDIEREVELHVTYNIRLRLTHDEYKRLQDHVCNALQENGLSLLNVEREVCTFRSKDYILQIIFTLGSISRNKVLLDVLELRVLSSKGRRRIEVKALDFRNIIDALRIATAIVQAYFKSEGKTPSGVPVIYLCIRVEPVHPKVLLPIGLSQLQYLCGLNEVGIKYLSEDPDKKQFCLNYSKGLLIIEAPFSDFLDVIDNLMLVLWGSNNGN